MRPFRIEARAHIVERSGDDGAVQSCSGELAPAQIGAGEIRVAQIGIVQKGGAEIRVGEIRAAPARRGNGPRAGPAATTR